jgi:hypothetical protein
MPKDLAKKNKVTVTWQQLHWNDDHTHHEAIKEFVSIVNNY